MKNYLYKSIFVFVVSLVLFSCNSKNEAKNEQQTTGEAEKDKATVLTAYNSKKGQNIQTFEINTSKQQTVKGKQGTVVTFPAQCFGKVQGTAKIELIECYSVQEMLLNGLSTQTTDGKLLESDGMIYLNALNEKGDTLKIKQGKVKVQMPTKQRKADIQIFDGVKLANTVRWNLSDKNLITHTESQKLEIQVPTALDTTQNYQTESKTGQSQIVIDKQIKNENLVNYVFCISKMGWQNCDRFIEGETKQLIVNVPKESTGASYYLVLKNYNSSALPKQTTDGKLSFIIPINEPFTIVALSSKGEDIYFNMMDYTDGKDEVDFSELKPVTRQELTDLLMKKFGKDIWSRPLA
jgi:hypothetical protein